MRSRYVLILLITMLPLTGIACQTDQDAVPTEVPAIPTATDAAAQPEETAPATPAEGEEDYPAPAEQETLPTPESYPEPTEDTS